ncbi:senescence-associated [Labeo rohita]|uniref:Senescence-associated n=1 Tax=Labeo rohita TaxID=84645 RepID=A0A498M2J9_LABRO|nr:senescence-associated [Labeo rohita]
MGRREAGLHLHCAVGARGHPLTRARVRLLGPCFKTGRVGGRPLRGPRAPVVRGPDPRPGGAARPRRTEDSPPRRAPAPGARGPVPPRGERGREDTARGPGVLFNFPSRYLSTIGLVPVFSLRWSLPPALGCIPKHPDSEKNRTPAGRGPLPASHRPRAKPPSEGLGPPARAERSGLPYATFPSPLARSGDSALGSSLFARRY